MTESADEIYIVEPQPLNVHLHLHRRAGVTYAILTVVVFTVVVLGVVSYVSSGRWVMGAVTAVVGLGLSAFLATLALSILGPGLYADSAGIRGRMDWRTQVEVGWDQVVVDATDEASPSQLRLQIAGRSLDLGSRSWYGFRKFVFVLITDPAASGSVTPEARAVIAGLIRPGPQTG